VKLKILQEFGGKSHGNQSRVRKKSATGEQEVLSRAILKLQGTGDARDFVGGFTGGRQRGGRAGNLRAFIQVDDALIRYFPAERFYVPFLFVAFFEEYGFSGIGGQIACCGKDDVRGPVGDLYPPAQQS